MIRFDTKKDYELYNSKIEENAKLQQENKKLNGAIQTYDILLKANTEENKQLKDNWNKLKEVLDKMQKLEQGSDSNGQ